MPSGPLVTMVYVTVNRRIILSSTTLLNQSDTIFQPQQNVNSANLACNGPPNPTMPTDKVIPVEAGSNVTAVWRHTLECGYQHRMKLYKMNDCGIY